MEGENGACRLPLPPEIDVPEGPIRRTDIDVAAILDDFSRLCFQYEANLIPITPSNWRDLLRERRPAFLFVESAWRGNANAWRYMIVDTRTPERGPGEPLVELVSWCKDQGIPTVFWNKEDPPNFDVFLKTARLFDHVFTSDANCIARYVEALGHERVSALPFGAQPQIHNPRPVPGGRPYDLAFAGTWYARKHPDRQAQADAVLRPALDHEFHIYDRMHGYSLAQRDYEWPPEYQSHIVGHLPYERMMSAYRQYRAFLNVNSVTDSPTMLSRRVFELLACGTPVISSDSKAIRELLGEDVVLLSASAEQTREHIDCVLKDSAFRASLAERACLAVMKEHTYSHRFEDIVRVIGLPQGSKPVALPMAENQLKALAGTGQADIANERFLSQFALLPPKAPIPKEADFEGRLDAYLERVVQSDARHVVFMFSGTTFIQERRGNRPIRLTRTMLDRNIPVFFSYYRWRETEPIAEDDHPLLFQSPIDLTRECMDRLLEHDFQGKAKVFIASFPHMDCARSVSAMQAQGWVTLYDIRDDWEEFHEKGHAKWYRPEYEHYLCNACDVVSAVSQPLCDKLQPYCPDRPIHLLPNALDTRFLAPFNAGRVAPRKGKPIVGYFGHLNPSWFDWESLIQIARRRRDCLFQIIGHFGPENLDLPDNVKLMGPRSHLEINEIAQRWRAAIIPFRIGKLADAVDPIKLYEYLALGLPTVSFRMPQIASYPYVHLASNVNEFVKELQIALNEPLDRRKIDEFLDTNRWEDRVDQIIAWADDAASRPRPLSGISVREQPSS